MHDWLMWSLPLCVKEIDRIGRRCVRSLGGAGPNDDHRRRREQLPAVRNHPRAAVAMVVSSDTSIHPAPNQS
jgi:hypothetical protein